MAIATIATGSNCLRELELLIFSIEQVYADLPLIYLFTDTASLPRVPKYKGPIKVRAALDAYTGLTRQQMSQRPGRVYKDLWTEFMCEKISVMRWALEEQTGVWFCDADISLLEPLPTVQADLALSPHYIRKQDETRYGKYNGGLVWCKDPKLLDRWQEASKRSRFFEQAALEEVYKAALSKFELPIQVNFSWWRLHQSDIAPAKILADFQASSKLLFRGQPIQSIHTHWATHDATSTGNFNQKMIMLLTKCSSPRANAYCSKLQQLFGWRIARPN